jgi:hypothetical protein
MRKSAAKIIRQLANHTSENAITRRVYRRLKKHYTRLNKAEKTAFMSGAKQMLEPIGV